MKKIKELQSEMLRVAFPMTHQWKMKQVEKAGTSLLTATINTMMFPLNALFGINNTLGKCYE